MWQIVDDATGEIVDTCWTKPEARRLVEKYDDRAGEYRFSRRWVEDPAGGPPVRPLRRFRRWLRSNCATICGGAR